MKYPIVHWLVLNFSASTFHLAYFSVLAVPSESKAADIKTSPSLPSARLSDVDLTGDAKTAAAPQTSQHIPSTTSSDAAAASKTTDAHCPNKVLFYNYLPICHFSNYVDHLQIC